MKSKDAFILGMLCSTMGMAQPDSLYFTMQGRSYAEAVYYLAHPDLPNHTLEGVYARDTSAIAVRLDIKRGKPSGVYRAFYPSGTPLIFAVYGWGTLHGDWTEYDEDGLVIVKGQFRSGERDGAWTFRREGIRGRYRQGERHGKWRYYEGKRMIRSEKYHRGELKQGGTFRFFAR